jgi:hypothetical protein
MCKLASCICFSVLVRYFDKYSPLEVQATENNILSGVDIQTRQAKVGVEPGSKRKLNLVPAAPEYPLGFKWRRSLKFRKIAGRVKLNFVT